MMIPYVWATSHSDIMCRSEITSAPLAVIVGLRDLHDNPELICDMNLTESAVLPSLLWLHPHTTYNGC